MSFFPVVRTAASKSLHQGAFYLMHDLSYTKVINRCRWTCQKNIERSHAFSNRESFLWCLLSCVLSPSFAKPGFVSFQAVQAQADELVAAQAAGSSIYDLKMWTDFSHSMHLDNLRQQTEPVSCHSFASAACMMQAVFAPCSPFVWRLPKSMPCANWKRRLGQAVQKTCPRVFLHCFVLWFSHIFAMFAHPLYLLCCRPSHCMMCCCLLHCIRRKGKCTKRPNRSSMNFWRGRLRCRSSQHLHWSSLSLLGFRCNMAGRTAEAEALRRDTRRPKP